MATLPNYITEEDGRYLAEKIKEKAPIASPALTGTPTAPTAAAGTNTTQLATTAFVKKAVDDAVSGIYTPKGSVDTAEELPDNPDPGDIWTVIAETVVTEDGEGKNVVKSLSGTVDTYDELPADAAEVADGAVYKVVQPYTDTSTDPPTEYAANSLWSAANDGTAVTWTNLTGEAHPAKTDYKYTEEDGWTAIDGVDLSEMVTKDELAAYDYIRHDELEPVPLTTVQGWFAESTGSDPGTGSNPGTGSDPGTGGSTTP